MLTKSRLKNLAQKASNGRAAFSSGCFYKYFHHFIKQKQKNIRRSAGEVHRFCVAPGLAVMEHVGARGHFDKSTPEILKDQV